MVSDVVVGVIKDSPEDPCGKQGSNYPPDYVSPDFDSCQVYDVVTCDSLDAMPNGGKWTMDQVKASTSGCIVKLFDYVYDVGSPPQLSNPFTPPNSGSLTFADKHGGGSDAVLRQCTKDMTEVFEGLVNKREIPDHTKGALNAILPYLVGVIEDSPSNPCRKPPPPICNPSEISYWEMSEVASQTTGCYAVVMGKVYNLAEFAQHHYGGRDEIQESCGDDITNDFLEKSFHSLAQLGAIQQFQEGVIRNSMADPCTSNYIANPDPIFGDEGTSGGDDGGDDSSGESDVNNGKATRAPISEPTPNPALVPASTPEPGDGSDSGGDGSDSGGSNNSFGSFNWCFPGDALVDVQGKGLLALKNLKIGDHILVDEGNRYEPVYSFGHKDRSVLGDFLQLTTDSGAQVEISKEHLIFVNNKAAVPALLVQPGDKLRVLDHLETVKSITSVTRQGAYAPFTPSGTIVVNGIKASTFVALQDSPSLIIGTFHTGLSFHWLAHTFELPRSLWCTHVASCADEEYTTNGISTWVEGPYKAALWFLEQKCVTMIIAAVPLLIWLGCLSVLEWIVIQGLTIGGFVLALVSFYTFFSVRPTTKIPLGSKQNM